MKKLIILLFIFILLFMGGCESENKEENKIRFDDPANQVHTWR